MPLPTETSAPGRLFLAGITLVGMSCLTFELVLTRLLSLTLYHHFVFLAISLAMLGIGFGGVALHRFPMLGEGPRVHRRTAWAAALFAGTMVPAFLAQAHLPLAQNLSVTGLAMTAAKMLCLATPFFFAGLCLSLALVRFPVQASRVYGMDLLGAGAGCIASIFLLDWFGGPGALAASAVMGAVGAATLFLSEPDAPPRGRRGPVLALLAVLAVASVLASTQLDLRPPNRAASSRPEVEAWNAFSHVSVYDIRNPARALRDTVSPFYQGAFPNAKYIQIDSSAGSDILDFSSRDPKTLSYLLSDIAYLGFQISDEKGKVLVIGPGGGRDALAAMLTGREQVIGVEVNPIVADLTTRKYGAYLGDLWQRPGFTQVVDEARSFLARDKEKYSFIHAALACTWSATAGGAFVLTENSLYTTEAFRSYFTHLDDSGMLVMTMWFRGTPGELMRLVGLGQQVLREQGIEDPARHIAVITTPPLQRSAEGRPMGFGTFILKKSAFLPTESERLRALTDRLGFTLRQAPGQAGDGSFTAALNGDFASTASLYGLDVSPPDDNRPFFFYQLRPADYLKLLLGAPGAQGKNDSLHRTVAGMLLALLAASAFWVINLLLLPLFRRNFHQETGVPRPGTTLAFFACIGVGFMLVEVPLIQQLSIFLGNPIHAFSVVLFTLLVCAGAGSLASQAPRLAGIIRPKLLFPLLLGYLTLVAFLLPTLLDHGMPWPGFARIGTAAALLAPLGFLLGMPLPLGISRLGREGRGIVGLAWAANGGGSVMASVLAMVSAINWGLRTTLVAGILCYLAAWVCWTQLPATTRSGRTH